MVKYAFTFAALVAVASAIPIEQLFKRTFATCPSSATSQLSCHPTGTAPTNTCCYNSPGGQLLQTQFWDAVPAIGPTKSWTLHGLWPDNCDGTYQQFCDTSRESTDITGVLTSFGKTDLLDFMNTYWKTDSGTDEAFWEHEWNKHGTCISTFDPACYTNYQTGMEIPDFFQRTVDLYKTLDTYSILEAAGIVPGSKTYTLAAIQAAITKVHGQPATVNCVSGSLDEVWYHFNVKGRAQDGTYSAAKPIGGASTCPATGIKYPAKSGGSSGGGGETSTTTTSSPTSTDTSTPTDPPSGGSGTAFSGKGFLEVSSGGCLISTGNWLTGGTCATYTAAASGSGFTLTSSKGACGVVSGQFSCGSGVSATTFTASSAGLLQSGSSSKFYASGTASGSTQESVYTTSSGHSTSFTISWTSS